MSVLMPQVVLASQQLLVFQMPPPSDPAQAIAGFVGWLTTTLMRPATPPPLPSGRGPSGVKTSGASAPGARRAVVAVPSGRPLAMSFACCAASNCQCGLKWPVG